MSTKEERAEQNRVYIKTNVNKHINSLIADLLKDKPESEKVLEYIIDWCDLNSPNSYEDQNSNKDKIILEPTAQNPEPIENSLPLEQNIIVQEKPQSNTEIDPKNLDAKSNGSGDNNDNIQDQESQNSCPNEGSVLDENELNSEIDSQRTMEKRPSVSGEAYGVYNKKSAFVPKIVEKTQETKDRIKKRLEEAFMFACLGDKEKEIVIMAMEECKFVKDDLVIKQGDDGDVLYTVDTGSLKCLKKLKKDDAEDTYLKTYMPGEAFGELAQLYNAPRAATIIAIEDSVCFSLDRDCFNNIVKESTIKTRERYDDFVNKIEVLKELDPYDRSKLTDVLVTEYFKKDEVVLKQGDHGDKLYFIEKGTAIATKTNEDGGESEVVYEYDENDYFGELALLNAQPRVANVIATSEMTLASIHASAFNGLLGPLKEYFMKSQVKYENYMAGKVKESELPKKDKPKKDKKPDQRPRNPKSGNFLLDFKLFRR